MTIFYINQNLIGNDISLFFWGDESFFFLATMTINKVNPFITGNKYVKKIHTTI
jgi:hypothetical protein